MFSLRGLYLVEDTKAEEQFPFFTFSLALFLGISFVLSNVLHTEKWSWPLVTKYVFYSFALYSNSSTVQQIRRHRNATPFWIPLKVEFWWHDSACRYKWLSVGLLYTVVCSLLSKIFSFLNPRKNCKFESIELMNLWRSLVPFHKTKQSPRNRP